MVCIKILHSVTYLLRSPAPYVKIPNDSNVRITSIQPVSLPKHFSRSIIAAWKVGRMKYPPPAAAGSLVVTHLVYLSQTVVYGVLPFPIIIVILIMISVFSYPKTASVSFTATVFFFCFVLFCWVGILFGVPIPLPKS